jgi:diguanylate cyclase (GGDEF)-like protein
MEAVLRIISGMCVIVFARLFRQTEMSLLADPLAVITGVYLLFLFLKKRLFRLFQGLSYHFVLELFELGIVLFACKQIPATQGLLLCILYLLQVASLCNKGQVMVLTIVTTIGYLVVSLINLAWQLVIDTDTLAFLLTTVVFIVVVTYVGRWSIERVKKSNTYLEETKNLLAVKQRLLEELEQSREKTRVYAEELSYVAKVDHLTTLYNRKYLYEYIDYRANQLKSESDEQVVVDLFVSNIAIFNEDSEFGESEKIVEGVADAIQQVIGTDDVAARYDGCEFVIVFPDNSYAEAEAKANAIKRAFELPREEHPEEWLLHIDYGVTTIHVGKDTVETIILRARKDRKRRGRG